MTGDGFYRRYTITVLGITVLIAAVLTLTNGQRQDAVVGVVLGGAMVVGNEWWAWRQRSRD